MPIPPLFPPSNHPAPFRLANDLLLRRTVGRRQRRAASILAVSSSHLCHVRGGCEMANHPRTIQNHPNMVVLCGFKWQILQKCWCEKSENPLVFSVRHEKRTLPISLKQKNGSNLRTCDLMAIEQRNDSISFGTEWMGLPIFKQTQTGLIFKCGK